MGASYDSLNKTSWGAFGPQMQHFGRLLISQ